MRGMYRHIILFCMAFLFIVCAVAFVRVAAAKPEAAEYHLVKKVTLGGAGRWDYFHVEQATHRIFIPRGTHLMVLDPEGKLLEDVKGLEGTHGIVFAPELKRAFLTDGDAKSVTILNPDTLKIIQVVKLPDRASDGILYDSVSKRLFTMNDDPATDSTAIDARTGKILGTIQLPDKAETAMADGMGHAYVNIEDKGEMTEFDTKTLKVIRTFSLAPCKIPTGLSIDLAHKRLFVGCRSGILAVVAYPSGKVVATMPIGPGVDSTRFDPTTQLVFASCGGNNGTITVAHEDTPDKYTKVQTIDTERGARTMALDEGNHNIYTVTSDFGPPPAPTKDEPHPRPTVISSTFRLLIYSR
ncbi:MAG: YncE family protein [Candidatus Acidiferrales bacterium]